MAKQGWDRLLGELPDYRGRDHFSIAAYSEFMPPPRIGWRPYGADSLAPRNPEDPCAWRIGEREETFELQPGLQHIAHEVLHALRIHAASFASVCPDPAAAFDSWWSGASPATGRATSLVILDPGEPRRRDPRPWRPMAEAAQLRPRYRDYADAVELLGLGGR